MNGQRPASDAHDAKCVVAFWPSMGALGLRIGVEILHAPPWWVFLLPDFVLLVLLSASMDAAQHAEMLWGADDQKYRDRIYRLVPQPFETIVLSAVAFYLSGPVGLALHLWARGWSYIDQWYYVFCDRVPSYEHRPYEKRGTIYYWIRKAQGELMYMDDYRRMAVYVGGIFPIVSSVFIFIFHIIDSAP